MRSAWYIIAFCCINTLTAASQDLPHFMEKLSTKEGLSSNKINDITQDDNGFLWIATSDGLNRFDGTEAVQYFHSDNANSISHNYVYCLKRLKGNYIAIGTQAGLDFYNSNTGKFTHFYYRQNNALDEFSNIITTLELDKFGQLWAASSNGIFIFDTSLQLKKILPSSFSEADIVRKRLRFVEKMLPLSNGDMLLYLSTGLQLYSAHEGRMINIERSLQAIPLQFLVKLYEARSVKLYDEYTPSANVFKIFDNYFLCIRPRTDSLYIYDEKGKLCSLCSFPYSKYPYILWSQEVSVIDSTRLLFLFHDFGLVSLAITWQNDRPVIHAPVSLLFEDHKFNAGLKDRQGNWWLATAGQGLQKISPAKQYFHGDTLMDQLNRRPLRYPVSALSRYEQRLWIATYGSGFFELNLQSGEYEQHLINFIPENRWPNFVWNLRQVSHDTLWLGTQAGMFYYSVPTKTIGRLPYYPGKPGCLDSVPITTQFVDSRGKVWMGLGRSRGLCCFDNNTHSFTYYAPNAAGGYPLRYPTAITEDLQGNLWMINDASSSLVYFDRKYEQFRLMHLPKEGGQALGNLSAIWCSGDTILWLGTVTDGLVKFAIDKGSVTVYRHANGLANDHISAIFGDDEKRLWLATEGNLTCFDQRTKNFTSYSERDGLPSTYPTANFYYDTENRRLYNGGKSVVFWFDPLRTNMDQLPQKTIITAMHINGELYMPDPNRIARLRSWQNDITIQYSAIDLSNGPGTKYAYKLVGEDTGWMMAGDQRQINFSHLSPGDYTFMVKASNRNGVWSGEPGSVHFYIRPPFVKTIWFYALILLATGGLFYSFYRLRLRQLLKTEQIRGEISRNLHDEVGSALTNISFSSLLAQKQLHDANALNKILKRIYEDSQHVSESMREIVWSINPTIDTLGESLPRMLHYASELLESKDIELQAEISPEIENLKLGMQQRRDLYLIFKETINNLARHSRASHVNIRFGLSGKTLTMIVSDDGIGFDTAAPLMNNGIKNMQERAKRHRWKLFIQSATGTGTHINLQAQIA